jgi:hypothetical protein
MFLCWSSESCTDVCSLVLGKSVTNFAVNFDWSIVLSRKARMGSAVESANQWNSGSAGERHDGKMTTAGKNYSP